MTNNPTLPIVEKLEALLQQAKYELACPRCYNGRGVIVRGMLDECPECHGGHRNTATIAFLDAMATLVRGEAK